MLPAISLLIWSFSSKKKKSTRGLLYSGKSRVKKRYFKFLKFKNALLNFIFSNDVVAPKKGGRG